jgi:sarcosine oxidase
MYDVIVIGMGSMGSAACYYLPKKGLNVLGIEQYDIVHDRGSHSGQTRIIRKAYFEHPNYVPLLERAYRNWAEIERISGKDIYYPAGLLYLGREEGELFSGLRLSASQYGIPLEDAKNEEIKSRYPAIQIPQEHVAIIEKDAGFLHVDAAISSYVQAAKQCGVDILTHCTVDQWKKIHGGYELAANGSVYRARKIIFCCGAWTNQILKEYTLPLKVSLQTLHWVEMKNIERFQMENFPCWVAEADNTPGVFYGFPAMDNKTGFFSGFKIAHHHPGLASCPETEINHAFVAACEENVRGFLAQYFPGQYVSMLHTKTCYYTNTPNHHFIIDYLPGFDEDLIIAAGFSGHGFKFVSAVGEILASMATGEDCSGEIGWLAIPK